MDGIHDLGGRQGFGPIDHAPDAPALKAPWEVEVNALQSLAVATGLFNMDEYRHAIERMAPLHYVNASYYERSLTGVASLLVEKGLATPAELDRLAGGRVPLSRPAAAGRGNVAGRRAHAVGDRVRVRNDHVPGHVRMPGYLRGRTGVVVAISPGYPFPDAHAHGLHADPEPTYDVCFRSEDLWPGCSDSALVHAGVFESYLAAT